MFHKRLLKEFDDNKKMIRGMVLTQWIALLANVVLIAQIAAFITVMFQNETHIGDILTLAATLVAVILIRSITTYINTKLSFEASKQVKERLRSNLYKKIMGFDRSYRDTFTTSEMVQLSTEGVEQLEIYFGKYVPQFFYSLLAPITLFFIVGTMSLKVATVLLICVPLIPVSIIAVQKFAKKMLAKYWGTYTQMGDSFLECLQGLTTLKIYQADERYAKKMDEEAERFRKVTMRVLIMQLNSISIMDLVAYGGAAVGIILGILEFKAGTISLAQCFFIIMISAEFFLPLRLLGSFFHIAMNGNAAADKIFKILDLEDKKEASIKEIKESTITFKDVSFGYVKDRTVLNHISFQAKKGLTAFVGESGCGKSTLISMIMGEYVPLSGEIFVGEAPINEIDGTTLKKKVTRVSHNSYLFKGTIRENLLMGNENATEQEMELALEKVNMLKFVMAQGGLDYELQEKAANLSGGQKQRLALARALLHDSDIYLFDEATSNVDAESEDAIMKVVRALSKVKTVVLISHRLANVVNANHIYVMKDGTVVEAGPHSSLLENKSYYRNLYQSQMELEHYGKDTFVYE